MLRLCAEEKIGPYTLVRKLGRGQFKEVWLAEERGVITTEVALGLMLDDSPEVLKEVEREAQVWHKAGGHPNVHRVQAVQNYDGQIVIVSEYAQNGSLEDWLNRHNGTAPSPEAALEMTAGILAGLAHLHSRQPPIIHRDLKPANVLLQGETPRITDFGISREQKAHLATTIAGTPVYMAPEAFGGDDAAEGHYSAQSDVWAAGVMLYQMLSGSFPFPPATYGKVRRSVHEDAPLPLPDTIPAAVQQVVLHALEKDPAQRYASASEMRTALLEAGRPAPEPPIVSRPGSFDPEKVKVFFDGLNRESELKDETVVSSEPPEWSLPPQAGEIVPIVPAMLPITKINAIDGAEMILIPAGEFFMGDMDMGDNPRRTVTLDAYYIYKTPVTVAQYRMFCEARGLQMPSAPAWGKKNSQAAGKPPALLPYLQLLDTDLAGGRVWKNNHPIVNISWNEAKAYCEWAGVSLPMEAQWEKAARGTDGRPYPWGGAWDKRKCQCTKWHLLGSGTAPVTQYPQGASPYGCMDMVGNVWEWCEDGYDEEQIYRVLRGGSWNNESPVQFRCSHRFKLYPAGKGNIYGFRCAAGVKG